MSTKKINNLLPTLNKINIFSFYGLYFYFFVLNNFLHIKKKKNKSHLGTEIILTITSYWHDHDYVWKSDMTCFIKNTYKNMLLFRLRKYNFKTF